MIRYNVINLTGNRWAQSAATYLEAVAIALTLEAQSGLLHGVERG